jgi:hypothetical protein
MWRASLAGVAAVALCGANAGSARACDGCGYEGYRYYYAYPVHAGFHEYYGFYNSGYTADADGGFYSTVGPRRSYRMTKRRLRSSNHRAGKGERRDR